MQMEVMVEMTYAEDAVNLKIEDILSFPCLVLPLDLPLDIFNTVWKRREERSH